MNVNAAWKGKVLLATLAFPVIIFALGCLESNELGSADADVDEPVELYWEADDTESDATDDLATEEEVCEYDDDPASDLDSDDLEDLLADLTGVDPDTDLPKESLQRVHRAIEQTRVAIGSLAADGEDNAREALSSAIEVLEEFIESHPEATLVTVDESIKPVSLVEDAVEAEQLEEEADRLLDDGDVRGATDLLDRLVSEAHQLVIQMPVDEYLQLLRSAEESLDAGGLDDGRQLLEKSLAKLQTIHRTLSLPLLEARKLIEAAARVAGDDPDRARELLEEVRERVRLAEILDHVDDSSCAEELNWDLEELADQVPTMEGGALFNEVRRQLRELYEQSESFLNPDDR